MNLANWLGEAATQHGPRGALFRGTEEVADYAGFYARAMACAGLLQARGLGEGARIAIFAKNAPEYLIALYGIWAMGGVAVPVNAKLHTREAAWIVEDSGAELVFTNGPLDDLGVETLDIMGLGIVGAPLGEIVPRGKDDLAWLFYTSGTTGRPKGVCITHHMLATMADCYESDVERVSPEDATLYAAPMSHGAGLYALMHVRAGARHICPLSGGFDPAEIFELAEKMGQVQMFAAPTMVTRMVAHARASGATGEGLRTIIYAGGPMYLADICEAVEVLGPRFAQIYGQGECPMGITALPKVDVNERSHPRWRERLASVGRAQSAIEIRIGTPALEMARGEVGEILVRGDVVMPQYWQNEAASIATLKGGWLHTGDVGFMDGDGYLTLNDRSKDVIISGGSNIYPREVEEVLLSHPSIAEASAIGRPHADWGEEVVACVVLSDGAALDEAALSAHLGAHIASFKRPKAYVVLPALPKNNYGKVLKTQLREMI